MSGESNADRVKRQIREDGIAVALIAHAKDQGWTLEIANNAFRIAPFIDRREQEIRQAAEKLFDSTTARQGRMIVRLERELRLAIDMIDNLDPERCRLFHQLIQHPYYRGETDEEPT